MKKNQLARFLAVLAVLFFSQPAWAQEQEVHTLTEADMQVLNKPIMADFDQMVEKRVIRVLMPYSRTFFFFDGAQPRGASYDFVKLFETFLNKKLNSGVLKVHCLVIPTARENLIPFIKEGRGDIAVGNITVTEDRLVDVDFTNPTATGINEILVSSVDSADLTSVFDLSGKKIHTRLSSSYYQSLLRLNETLKSAGKKEATIIPADDNLEDEDLLEMVNAGIIEYIIIDSHKGELWAQVFDKIKLQQQIKLRTEGKISWAIRKNSPELKSVINEFLKENKLGTLMGNVLFKKYFKDTKYINSSIHNEHEHRFKLMVHIFEKYGTQYQFDYLMLAALGYQESQLDQNVKSAAGAIGVMQVLPSTAKDKNVGIPDIYEAEPNIHAGTKYLRFMTDRYFSDDDNVTLLNRTLFAFASYNAGPAKVARMRKDAEKMGFDPNIWFNNVEVVAAKQIGRETVQYVSNIFKYYIAYTLMADKFITEGPVHLTGSAKKKKK